MNSKTNTILLVTITALLVVGLWMMYKKNTAIAPLYENDATGYVDTKSPGDTTGPQSQTAPVQSVVQGAVVLNLNNQYAKTYATLFTKEFAEPANYAGHFRLVAPGCGSNCFTLFALDKNTGETYKLGNDSGQDYQIRGNAVTVTSQSGVQTTYTFNETTKKFESS